MTRESESQIELDIAAYVNGQLDAERRFAVAQYLAAHPERAAEVMADLRLTDGLRLAFGTVETPASEQLELAAAKLERGLQGRHRLRRWIPFAAAVAMFAFGWMAQSYHSGSTRGARATDVAGLVDAALQANDAVSLGLSMADELGPMPRDAKVILARLGIALPELPHGWTVRAAQVVGAPSRPGVAIVIDTPDLGEIMLFSVVRSIDGPDEPTETVMRDGRALAFFERGLAAYVLVDKSGPVSDLRRGAEQLRHRFN